MKRQESFCTVGGNVSWCSPYGNSIEVHQKLKIELPYDLGISLWSIYLKETKTLTWRPSVHCSNICSVARLCLTLCNPMDMEHARLLCPSLPPKVCSNSCPLNWWCYLSHPLWPLSSSAFNIFQHQGLSQSVSSSQQVAKVLELQIQHQSLKWIFRVDFL